MTEENKEIAGSETAEKNYVDLKFPVEIDGKAVKRLSLRRPKGKDLKRMDAVKGEMNKTMTMIPVLCIEAITPAQVDEMDGSDIMKLNELLADFLGM